MEQRENKLQIDISCFKRPKIGNIVSKHMTTIAGGALRVGLVGCGNISNAYFKGLKLFPETVEITACVDMDLQRAEAKAAEHGVKKACSLPELLNDPDIDAVLNLTIPAAHAKVNLEALQAGKHAYCEKPFALDYQEGIKVVAEANKRGLRVGSAPDTVLGAGIQTCRKVIDDGGIGEPISAVANMLCRGHERWHPNPEFYYQEGGGPLFDMGPYYLTALVTMFGPVKSVMASAKTTFKERVITSEPLKGKKIDVKVPTHLVGLLEFVSGATATVTMSFDVWNHHLPLLEIYGTEGSLQCPDPNWFSGEVQIWTPKADAWSKVPLLHEIPLERGTGLAEMAHSIQKGRVHRLNGDLGLHIVEVMEAFHTSSDLGKKLEMQSTCAKPEAFVGKLD